MAPTDPVRVTEMVEVVASPGLSTGVHNSLAYRVAEIERHIHSNERWFGVATVPSATHKADRIGPGVEPFLVDAGNNIWGAWVQILGSADTPADAGNAYFDLHRLMITSVERNTQRHFVQIGGGASGAAALAAGHYTEFMFVPATAQAEETPVVVRQRRGAAASLVWARIMVPGQDTGEMEFYFGLHEYEG